MISANNIILSARDVPNVWIFEFFLKLQEPLTGQNILVRSPFSNDSVGSFWIYRPRAGSDYRWRCFSSNLRGDVIDLVAYLHNQDNPLPRKAAIRVMVEAYRTKRAPDYRVAEQLPNSPGRVTHHQVGKWLTTNLFLWSTWGITELTLHRYRVAPLVSFHIEKLVNGELRHYDFHEPHMYGYFTVLGELGKIYRPGRKRGKFILVQSGWVQGMDQLQGHEELIIQSSLKDGMCFGEMIQGYDFIAPDGEGILLPPSVIEPLKLKHKRIRTLMDNDKAGEKASLMYQEIYGFDPIRLKLSKDVAKSREDHGLDVTRTELIKLL